MERDPFDKDTFESPIFDDSRSDSRRLFGILRAAIPDRVVGPGRGAPWQFLAAGILVLLGGLASLFLVLVGFFAKDSGVGIALTAFLLALGALAMGGGLAGRRKGAKTR